MPQHTLSILLIDDDEHVQNIFKMVAEHFSLWLQAVKDGESALNILERYSPDVIIVDLYLFGADGFQILRQIRTSELNPGCPIVATTSYDSTTMLGNVLLAGFDAYLPKPFSVFDLAPFLNRVISGSLPADSVAPALIW